MASVQPLKFLTVAPRSNHTASVIFLHGLGDSGHGWFPVANMLSTKFPHVKWILPHAPIVPVTLSYGMQMPSWFDINSLTLSETAEEDENGMLKASRSVNELITAEVDAGIDAKRIVLGGFSQGCALAVLTAMTTERRLGGLVALSGWLPLRTKINSMMSDHARSIPVFWGHGEDDEVVQYKYGEMSVQYLVQKVGFQEGAKGITWKAYNDMGHSSDPREIADMVEWLKNVIPETTGDGQ